MGFFFDETKLRRRNLEFSCRLCVRACKLLAVAAPCGAECVIEERIYTARRTRLPRAFLRRGLPNRNFSRWAKQRDRLPGTVHMQGRAVHSRCRGDRASALVATLWIFFGESLFACLQLISFFPQAKIPNATNSCTYNYPWTNSSRGLKVGVWSFFGNGRLLHLKRNHIFFVLKNKIRIKKNQHTNFLVFISPLSPSTHKSHVTSFRKGKEGTVHCWPDRQNARDSRQHGPERSAAEQEDSGLADPGKGNDGKEEQEWYRLHLSCALSSLSYHISITCFPPPFLPSSLLISICSYTEHMLRWLLVLYIALSSHQKKTFSEIFLLNKMFRCSDVLEA